MIDELLWGSRLEGGRGWVLREDARDKADRREGKRSGKRYKTNSGVVKE